MAKCMMCDDEITFDLDIDKRGLQIWNKCIDIFPEYIYICRICTKQFAIQILSGSFSIMGIGKIFTSLMKGKKS